jgi:hypothetical protein
MGLGDFFGQVMGSGKGMFDGLGDAVKSGGDGFKGIFGK